MKQKIIWGIVIFLAIFLILHGFLGKNARQRQEGEVYYLKNTQTANTLYHAKANTKDETPIYTHEGKGDCKNQKILAYYYNEAENLIYFVALKKDNAGQDAFGLYSIQPGNSDAEFVKFYPEFDGKGEYSDLKVQISKDGKTLYNDKGSLCFQQGTDHHLLKKFGGIYNKEISPGYVPIGITPDGNYALYSAKVSSSKFMKNVNEFLTQVIYKKPLGEDIYIVDLRDNTSSRYVKDAYDFQFVS